MCRVCVCGQGMAGRPRSSHANANWSPAAQLFAYSSPIFLDRAIVFNWVRCASHANVTHTLVTNTLVTNTLVTHTLVTNSSDPYDLYDDGIFEDGSQQDELDYASSRLDDEEDYEAKIRSKGSRRAKGGKQVKPKAQKAQAVRKGKKPVKVSWFKIEYRGRPSSSTQSILEIQYKFYKL